MAALLSCRSEENIASSTLQSQSSTLPCAFRPLVKPTYTQRNTSVVTGEDMITSGIFSFFWLVLMVSSHNLYLPFMMKELKE